MSDLSYMRSSQVEVGSEQEFSPSVSASLRYNWSLKGTLNSIDGLLVSASKSMDGSWNGRTPLKASPSVSLPSIPSRSQANAD